MLRSGSFAFIGALESPRAEPDTYNMTRVALCCNVVIGMTHIAVQDAADDHIESLNVSRMEAMLMPGMSTKMAS